MWFWLFKYVLMGPILRLIGRPKVTGLENLPAHGPAILASNHLAVVDSFYLPLMIPRRMYFLAKSGVLHRDWFQGCIPAVVLQFHRSDPDRPHRGRCGGRCARCRPAPAGQG